MDAKDVKIQGGFPAGERFFQPTGELSAEFSVTKADRSFGPVIVYPAVRLNIYLRSRDCNGYSALANQLACR